MGFLLCVIANPNIMSCLGEGVPRDVKPTIAGQELVSIGTDLQELHQMLELGRIFRSDVGSLTNEVLRVLHTAHSTVYICITEARINDDGTQDLAGRFQQQMTAISQIHHDLHRGNILRIFLQIQKLAQLKVGR